MLFRVFSNHASILFCPIPSGDIFALSFSVSRDEQKSNREIELNNLDKGYQI
jgi:hypothetical protein